jgi:hypothetical protein
VIFSRIMNKCVGMRPLTKECNELHSVMINCATWTKEDEHNYSMIFEDLHFLIIEILINHGLPV